MPQLYIAAAVTSLIAICMFGALVRQLSSPEFRWKLLCLACLGLPLSSLAYFFVRLPLIRVVEVALHGVTQENPSGIVGTILRDGILLLYAPLTEEPFKLLPWILLLIFGKLQKPTHEQVVPLALTIGAAFAIGEFWTVAYLIAAKPDPALAQLPWYAFGGYMSERIATCFSHALFALPTILLCRRSWLLAACGLLVGMVLHYLGNAPIMLMHQEAFGLSKATWSTIVQVWLMLFVLITLIALAGFHFGNDVLARIWQNKMICPECGATYRQPLALGLNMGTWRYEPCGECHKWHWVTIKNLAPLENSGKLKLPDSDQD